MNINHNLIQKLIKTGLNEKEATIYGCLLEMGGGYPSKVSEITRLNRSTVYKILTSLAVKGLVTEIEKGKKLFFQPESPEQLLKYSEAKSHIALNEVEYAKKVFPELEGLFSLSPGKPVVRFFQNREGLLAIWEDQISVTQPYEMVGFANVESLEEIFPTNFFKNYVKRKEELKITTRGILKDTSADRTFNERMYATIKTPYKLQIRFVPEEYIPFNGELICYADNKVSIVNKTESGYIGIIIEDKPIHDMMRKIFELAWIGAADVEKNKK